MCYLHRIMVISPYTHSCKLLIILSYCLDSFVLYHATSFTFLTFSINSCNIVNLLRFLAFLTFLLIFICKYISEEGRRSKRHIKAGTVRSLLQVLSFCTYLYIYILSISNSLKSLLVLLRLLFCSKTSATLKIKN